MGNSTEKTTVCLHIGAYGVCFIDENENNELDRSDSAQFYQGRPLSQNQALEYAQEGVCPHLTRKQICAVVSGQMMAQAGRASETEETLKRAGLDDTTPLDDDSPTVGTIKKRAMTNNYHIRFEDYLARAKKSAKEGKVKETSKLIDEAWQKIPGYKRFDPENTLGKTYETAVRNHLTHRAEEAALRGDIKETQKKLGELRQILTPRELIPLEQRLNNILKSSRS